MKEQRFNSSTSIGAQTFDYAHLNEGNLLIPDISGFTRFVHDTDMDTGRYVNLRNLQPTRKYLLYMAEFYP